MSRRLLMGCVSLVALLGCASGSGVRAELLDESQINRNAIGWYPDEDAVVLKSANTYRLERDGRSDSRTRVTLRKITAVRTEKGRDAVADLKLRLPAKTKMLDVKARVLQEDGTRREVAGTEVFLLEPPKEVEDGQLLFALRFPDVRAGSILEYAIIYEYPEVWWYMSESAHDAYPVVDYSVDVECDPRWSCHVATFNAQAGPTLDQVGSYWRLRWNALRMDAKPDEAFSPHWRSDHSWWANRIKGFNDLPDDYTGDVSWGVAMRWHAEGAFIESSWAEGYETPRPLPWAGCTDQKCKFDKTVEWVRSNIELTGENSYARSRKLSAVLKTKKGSDGERAVLLARLLADAGLESWLAGVVFADQGELLKDFPARDQLSQALVFVPQQGNLAEQYVDTLCDFCGANQIRPSAVGVTALHFRAIQMPARPKVETRFVTVNATPAPVRKSETLMRVAVDQQGAVTAKRATIFSSTAAIPWALWKRHLSPEDRDKQPINEARTFGAKVPATNYALVQCDLRKGECAQGFDLTWPSGASVEQDQIVLTLPMFVQLYRGTTTATRRLRDIVRFEPSVLIDEAIIAIPDGFEFTQPAEMFKKTSPLFDSEVSISKQQDGVHIRRQLTTRAGRRSKNEIAEVQDVLKNFDSAARIVVVFNRKAPAPAVANAGCGESDSSCTQQ